MMEPAVQKLSAGGYLPARYGSGGENVSSGIRRPGVPEGARELALMFGNRTPRTRPPFAQRPREAGGCPKAFATGPVRKKSLR